MKSIFQSIMRGNLQSFQSGFPYSNIVIEIFNTLLDECNKSRMGNFQDKE